MANNERIEDTILRERKTLEPLRIMADYVLDTSYTKDAQFKKANC
jgi:RNase adaptor protein for sRNA GlmZ degradation